MALPNWSPKPPDWASDTYGLLKEDSIVEPTKQSFTDITQNSEKFPIAFPIDTGRCKTLKNYVSESILERNINSVYPVIHENTLELYCKFILFKRQHGSRVEKDFYKNMSLIEFVNRLLTTRAVMFMGKDDKYILLNGIRGSKNWETIGTDKEQPPLVLKDCISYDEVKLSAFLSVSSYTYFVNLGDRKNMAKYSTDRKKIEDEGIIVGMIGPRLKKPNVMEYQEIVINDKQNLSKNGYGTSVNASVHKLFSSFYGEPCRDYGETVEYKKSLSSSDMRYTELKGKNTLFDNHLYYKRLTISIDTLLMEANFRAKLRETTAYVHIVGLGLGVWRASPHQDEIYIEAFSKRISELGSRLHSISDICFSYIDVEKCGNSKNGDIFPIDGHPKSGIKIHILKRQPHEKLINENAGKLSVVSYAWDGNALPGNEYWSGKLGSSGDSAAASSTQVPELHNPHINPLVSGHNLRVVTKQEVVTLKKYQELVRCENQKRKS